MKATFNTVLILRDAMTKIPKLVPAWEVPILRSQYGDENVQFLPENMEVEISEMPDAKEEFARLKMVYGTEDETKQTHADIAYGRGEAGLKQFEAAMRASIKGDPEAAQAVSDKHQGIKATAEVKDAREKAYLDPLENVALSGPLGVARVAGEADDAINEGAKAEAAQAAVIQSSKK